MHRKNHTLERTEEGLLCLVFLLFPVLFLSAQLLHPGLFQGASFSNGAEWIVNFRNQSLLHLAHLFEFICAPLLMVMAIHFRKILKDRTPWLVSIGALMAFIGALMLLGNKSALCLTISGFDQLTDGQLQNMIPALDVLLARGGYLAVLNLLPLLPLGFVLIGIALIRTRIIPLWQGICITLGSLLLANPEIEMINFIASIFLFVGIIPYGIKLFSNWLKGAENES